MKQFTSDQFTWKNGVGTAELSSLVGKSDPAYSEQLSRFCIRSTKSGHTRTYELDTQSPGYEDGWDGEYNLYTDNLFDGTRVIIWNYWFDLSFICYHTSDMKTKTKYQAYWWCTYPDYSIGWVPSLSSTNLNSPRFQKHINELMKNGKFKIVETTETVICTDKTAKQKSLP
jgi:hypothetical protein